VSDAKLRAAGTLLLALAVLSLAAGILSNVVSGQSVATSIALGIGGLFLLVGVIAWILGRMGRTPSHEAANPRLRSWGFVLLAIGLFAVVAGSVGVALTQLGTLPRSGSWAVVTAGLYVAIAATVIVAISHRVRVNPTSPSVPER
jgi:hypothetical protein